jgi:uncharacterized OB-fold protein
MCKVSAAIRRARPHPQPTPSFMHDETHPPVPARASARYLPHLEALRKSQLVVRQCTSCGTRQWPPRPCCQICLAEDFNWIELPPEADVYTYTVCYRAFHDWFAARTPYAVVVAQLLPDVRIVGPSFGDVERLECGVRVHANFGLIADGWPILCWEPLEQ